MLMHVTPNEVAGLNHLAKSMGGEITINPHTGLPEAGFLDFFTSMLPMAAGILLAPGTGGASLVASSLGETAAAAAPVVAGMGVGAAVAGAKGDDPLMGGLMGGLGGYGGGNIGSSLGKMGAAGGYDAGSAAAKSLVGPQFNATTGLSSAGIPGPSMMTTLANQTAPTTFAEGMGNIGSGLKQLASDPMGKGYDAFKAAGGSGTQLATSIGIPALQAMQPEPIDTTDEEAKRKAEENKYRDPITGRLNLAQASPGLRLATGGSVNTNQSSISSGGIQDLYGTNDNTKGDTGLSTDGYGIGRLNTLASEGSRAKAADMFYAAGGPIAFAEGGSSDIKIPGYNDSVGSALNYNIQGSNNPMASLLMAMFKNNPALMAKFGIDTSTPTPAPVIPSTPATIDPLNAPGMYPQAADNYMASVPTDKGTYTLKAKGGYLDGHGDGMSDSIPATIEGKQPARLADGEFVIPADVVSHLGNGSSKAGSKQLYAMMEKVRRARTGNSKQGKEINPNKYMPA
jgi:hypothetical protein